MLDKIDDYLFYAKFGFQNISDECKKLTGLTNFGIAKWMYICTAVLFVFLLVTWSVLTNMSTILNSIFYLILAFVSIFMICVIFVLETKDKEFTKNHSGIMNEERVKGRALRVWEIINTSILLICIPYFFLGNTKLLFEISSVTYFFTQVFFLLGLYFEGCTPLPPSGKSKMKKWYEKTLATIKKRMLEKEDLSGPQFWQ